LVLMGNNEAVFYTRQKTYHLKRHNGHLDLLSKLIMPSLFVAFAYMASTIGATSVAYLNALMALLQWLPDNVNLQKFLPLNFGCCGCCETVFAPLRKVVPYANMIPLLGTSAMLLAFGWTDMILEHQSYPQRSWLSLLLHQHTYLFGALLLPAFQKLTTYTKSDHFQGCFLKDADVIKYATNLALLCFLIMIGAVLALVNVAHGAILSRSKTMLSVACGGMSGIFNTVKSSIESQLSNLSFPRTEDVENGLETPPDSSSERSRWGETLSVMLLLPNGSSLVVLLVPADQLRGINVKNVISVNCLLVKTNPTDKLESTPVQTTADAAPNQTIAAQAAAREVSKSENDDDLVY